MENASKALLIAASVLIVILLIAFGMRIFNSTTGTADSIEGTMETTEVATFNNKFMGYLGKQLSASEAYALTNVVVASNGISTHQITLKVTKGNVTSIWKQNQIGFDYSKKYKAGMATDSKGYINLIIITEQ